MSPSALFASTVLNDPCIRPGTMIPGHVNLRPGPKPIDVQSVTTTLATYVGGAPVDVLRHQVSAGFQLAAGRTRSIPFVQPVPWETPFTQLDGRPLPAVTVELRITVTATDDTYPGDPEPVPIHPTAGQWRFFAATRRLGWTPRESTVRAGQLPGVRQSVPFLQWFELVAPDRPYHFRVAFVANPVGVDVLLDAPTADRLRFAVTHAHDGPDPTELINDWLDRNR